MIVFEPEPSELIRAAVGTARGQTWLRPWRLPQASEKLAPATLRRFVGLRAQEQGLALPGFTAAELAARAWAGSRSDRQLHSKFQLRTLASRWAARKLGGASVVVAPSNAARAIFAQAHNARKVLIFDMPHLRGLHEDLDRERDRFPDCRFLARYRAPEWAIVDQEVELLLADEVWVRGFYLRDRLRLQGVADERLRVLPWPGQVIEARPIESPGLLHVLLAGLAAARNGSNELYKALQARPWLRVHVRGGLGAEPAAFLQHPQVQAACATSLASVHAVVAPSLCEAYLADVSSAAASGLALIATHRGAGSVAPETLFRLLPTPIGDALGEALDALYAQRCQVQAAYS